MRAAALGCLMAVGCALTAARAADIPTRPPGLRAPDYATAQIATADLGHGVYMLSGAAVNATVAVAKDGAIVVDDEWPPMADKLLAAIKKLTNAAHPFVVNTHFHSDHAGGNDAFQKSGAIIVAHDGVPKRLLEGYDSANGSRVMPAPQNALPVVTYSDKAELHLAGQTALLTHTAAAHTDGDTFVYFPEANVLATGDLFNSFAYESANLEHDGTLDGLIAAEAAMLAIANDQTKIVPGHGPLTDKKDLAAFHNLLVQGRARVAALMKQGKSLQEIFAAKPVADVSANIKRELKNDDSFVAGIYRALGGK